MRSVRSEDSYYLVASEDQGSGQVLYWLSYLRVSPVGSQISQRNSQSKMDTRNRRCFATPGPIKRA